MSLSKTSVGMGLIVAQALAAKGIELAPIPETPVQVLTDLSTQQLVVEEGVNLAAGGFERTDLSVSLLSGSDAVMPGTEVSPHTEQMSESVALLERVLNNTLDLTQNIVNPMINRVFEAIGAHIDERLQASGSPLEIVQQRHDPILDSVYLQESVGRYRNQPRNVLLMSFGLQVGNVSERLTTGHNGMDAQIQDFLNRQGVEKAAEVWTRIFGSAPSDSSGIFSRTSLVNEAVFAYFFAAKARNEPPSEANVELSEWRAYCSSVLAAAGATICAALDERVEQRKFGRMVISYPLEPTPFGQIVVDGDKYADWLSQGGSPELIFATAYGDRKFDPKTMIDQSVRLKAEWDNVMSLYSNTINYKRFDAMVEGMRAAVCKEIMALPDDQLWGDRSGYHDRLRDFAHKAKQRDLQDLWHFARTAVCQVVFPQTDAEALLLAIDEQSKLHPNKDVRELALYATIELVARWLADQLVVKNH